MRIIAMIKGRSKLVEEAGRRVKVEHVQVKEDLRRTSRWNIKGQFLRVVMTCADRLKDVSVVSYGCG